MSNFCEHILFFEQRFDKKILLDIACAHRYNDVVKKCNIYTIILVLLVISSVVLGGVFSGKTANADEVIMPDVPEQEIEVQPQGLAYVNFSTFNQAFNYVFSSLSNSKGYQVHGYGKMNLGFEWYSLCEEIRVTKIVDNINGVCSNEFSLSSYDSIGRNVGVRLVDDKNNVSIKTDSRRSGDYTAKFDYSNKQEQVLSREDYKNTWGTLPENLCLNFDFKKVKVLNKSLVSNRDGYVLKFQIPSNEIFSDFWKFLQKVIDYKMLKETIITVSNLTYQIHIDRYGRIKNVLASTDLSVNLKNLDFPYSLIPTMYATISFNEVYTQLNQPQIIIK